MLFKLKPIARELLIFLGYFTLAVLMTLPLVFYLDSSIPGVGSDPISHYWNSWRFSYSLQAPLIFHTVEAPDPFFIQPFRIIYVIITAFFADLLSYNLLILLEFALSAYGCYRLTLYILKDRWAAVYSGVIFGLSPFMFAKGMGHTGALQAISIPLVMLEFFKALDSNEYCLKRSITAGIWAGIAVFTSVYFAIYVGLWLLGLAFWLLATKRSNWVLNWITTVSVMVVLALPKAITMIKPAAEASYLTIKTLGKWYLTSIDLLGIITPHWNHPIWGSFFDIFHISSPERAAFLGISVLILAVLGWRKHQYRDWRIWIGIWTLSAWILSLGPMLQIAGKPTFIPLPDAVLSVFPIISAVTSVSMWMVLAVLGVALLAGGGVAWLHRRGNWWRWTWIAVILIAVIEYLPNPYPVIQMKKPVVLKQLAEDPANKAVLSLPVGGRDTMGEIGSFDPMSIWYQTLHRKPIIGGRVSRMSETQRNSLDSDLIKRIIHTQDSVILSEKPIQAFNPRSQGIRVKILRWVEKDSWLAGLIKKIIGQAKLDQVLNKAKRDHGTPLEALPTLIQLDSETALNQADSLDIGFVLANDLSSSVVKGALRTCKEILPLELIGEEMGVALYKVIYSDNDTLTALYR
ncbi:hypothetical protein K9N50_01565 [bacterium]|nr:hypothetical protein [bacterium]